MIFFSSAYNKHILSMFVMSLRNDGCRLKAACCIVAGHSVGLWTEYFVLLISISWCISWLLLMWFVVLRLSTIGREMYSLRSPHHGHGELVSSTYSCQQHSAAATAVCYQYHCWLNDVEIAVWGGLLKYHTVYCVFYAVRNMKILSRIDVVAK